MTSIYNKNQKRWKNKQKEGKNQMKKEKVIQLKDTMIFKSFTVRRKNGLTHKTNFTEFWKMYGKTFAEASKKFDDGILYNEPAKIERKEVIIHIRESDNEEGFVYDLYDDEQKFENGDSYDGGLCTSTFENAVEMAIDQI